MSKKTNRRRKPPMNKQATTITRDDGQVVPGPVGAPPDVIAAVGHSRAVAQAVAAVENGAPDDVAAALAATEANLAATTALASVPVPVPSTVVEQLPASILDARAEAIVAAVAALTLYEQLAPILRGLLPRTWQSVGKQIAALKLVGPDAGLRIAKALVATDHLAGAVKPYTPADEQTLPSAKAQVYAVGHDQVGLDTNTSAPFRVLTALEAQLLAAWLTTSAQESLDPAYGVNG